ncbi:MAG: hypothetical protein JST58_06165 [Bacteroidetes bacterium]|nr:hypothetical protein [Bacteroidota bacterium]
MDENTLERFRHYITTYARYPVYNIQSQLQLEVPISKWLPYWWWNLNLADKVLISTIVMSIVYNLFFLRRFITITKKHFFVFLAILVGCIFWFIKAPGPRFGTGYLICLVYFLLTPIFSTTNPAQGVKSILPFKLAIAIFLIAITGYCNYRLVKFFQPSEIIFPAGIEKVEYQPYNYMNLQMNYVDKNTNVCGATPVPCITDSINNFVPRGNTVEEGFKSKPTQ